MHRPASRPKRPIVSVVALYFSLLSACAGGKPAGEPSPAPGLPIHLTVVGTNDLHGWVQAKETKLADGTFLRAGGAAAFSAYLAAIREENPGGVILLDAGDLFQGTLAANLSEGEVVIATYNALGYDGSAIGNHEFDYGPVGPRSAALDPANDDPLGALGQRAAQARFPLLARNVYLASTGKRPSFLAEGGLAVIERKGVKIGLLGLLTPLTPQVTNPVNVRGLRFESMAAEAKSGAEALRKLGADVVIGLVHAGGRCSAFEDPRDLKSCDRSGEIFEFLEAVPAGSFDAVLAAHTHTKIAHVVNGMPVIQSGAYGQQFGRIDLFLDAATRRPLAERTRVAAGIPICEKELADTGDCDAKKWKPGSTLRPSAYLGRPVVPDAAIAAIVQPYLDKVAKVQAKSLHVTIPETLTREYQAESPLGNALADVLREMEKADVALLNSGGLRADLPKGELTNGALFEVFPFDNSVATLQMTGDEIVALLEALLSSGHGAPQTSGLRFVVERCAGKATISSITLADGKPFVRTALYKLTTSDFLALGGDGLGVVLEKIPASRKDVGHTRDANMRDALAAYLESRGGELAGRVDGRMVIGPGKSCPP